jgi:RNA polymerase sigma-70 factor (ECF subfamily)
MPELDGSPEPEQRQRRLWRRNPNGDRLRTSGVIGAATALDVQTAEPALATDADLLHRVALGDQAAFAQFYDQLAPMVHGVVLKVMRDPSQSEEVTQEVFVELWRSATRFDSSRGSVRSWAAMVAHRRAVDRVRSEQASRRRDDRESLATPTAHDPVVAEVESSIDQYRVRKAMSSLTAAQREAVELAYFGGYTYREVATLLSVPEGTIKTRIRDGMIKLRDELGGGA